MYNKLKKNLNNSYILQFLLYIFLIASSMSPIFLYYFNLKGLHLVIMALMFTAVFLFLLNNDKIIINRSHKYIFIYCCFVTVFSISGNLGSVFFIQSISYRVFPPLIFLLMFSLSSSRNSDNSIGYNIIIVTNFICIILAVIGLVEIYNPTIIYKFYGDELTTHLSLLIGDGVRRLISFSGNPINLGFYLTIGIGSALALILINWKKSKLIVFIQSIFIFISIYVMFLTYSRSAVLTTAVICVSFLFLLQKQLNIIKKIVILILLVFVYFIVSDIISNVDGLETRISSISVESFFSNVRFIKASKAFHKDMTIIDVILGNGIGEVTKATQHVLELGYASILYETGIIGLLIVVGTYIRAIFKGAKCLKGVNDKDKYIFTFYIAVIISGLAGLSVMDIYMQQPYNIYLWFSTFFLLSRILPKNKETIIS